MSLYLELGRDFKVGVSCNVKIARRQEGSIEKGILGVKTECYAKDKVKSLPFV